jgi:Inner membrane protein YgaP-like, transmembrane domain
MHENVGRVDQIVRFIVGPALMAVGIGGLGRRRGSRIGPTAVLLFGESILSSAVTRVCPLNRALGIDTRSQQERARDHDAVCGVVHAPLTSATKSADLPS